MSQKRRAKGWWLICLMAGCATQPLLAAEPGAISRAVEVAPPKGWTPDMPLFHEEATGVVKADAQPSTEPVVQRSVRAEGAQAVARHPAVRGSSVRSDDARKEPEKRLTSRRSREEAVERAAANKPSQKKSQQLAKSRAGRLTPERVAKAKVDSKGKPDQRVASATRVGRKGVNSREERLASNSGKAVGARKPAQATARTGQTRAQASATLGKRSTRVVANTSATKAKAQRETKSLVQSGRPAKARAQHASAQAKRGTKAAQAGGKLSRDGRAGQAQKKG